MNGDSFLDVPLGQWVTPEPKHDACDLLLKHGDLYWKSRDRMIGLAQEEDEIEQSMEFRDSIYLGNTTIQGAFYLFISSMGFDRRNSKDALKMVKGSYYYDGEFYFQDQIQNNLSEISQKLKFKEKEMLERLKYFEEKNIRLKKLELYRMLPKVVIAAKIPHEFEVIKNYPYDGFKGIAETKIEGVAGEYISADLGIIGPMGHFEIKKLDCPPEDMQLVNSYEAFKQIQGVNKEILEHAWRFYNKKLSIFIQPKI